MAGMSRTVASKARGWLASDVLGKGEHLIAWQPIESAPKDGTEIDVWVRSFSVGPAGELSVKDVGRYPKAYWGVERQIYSGPYECREGDEGWLYYDAPSHLLIEAGDYRVTHWMPIPDPPTNL